MKKKLLAGIMALALCSTSIPQMIFAEEFTSEAPEETGETPEVFTDENPATTNDTIGGASTFSSEEIPEFDDEEGKYLFPRYIRLFAVLLNRGNNKLMYLV